MNVKIEVIPHTMQRYPTVGDWFLQKEVFCPDCGRTRMVGVKETATLCGCGGTERDKFWLVIRVSELGNVFEEMCIAVHELTEYVLLHKRGVTAEQVDQYDIAFEQRRQANLDKATTDAERDLLLIAEPGDQPDAPYHNEHCFASGFERTLAAALGIAWGPYEEKIERL